MAFMYFLFFYLRKRGVRASHIDQGCNMRFPARVLQRPGRTQNIQRPVSHRKFVPPIRIPRDHEGIAVGSVP